MVCNFVLLVRNLQHITEEKGIKSMETYQVQRDQVLYDDKSSWRPSYHS